MSPQRASKTLICLNRSTQKGIHAETFEPLPLPPMYRKHRKAQKHTGTGAATAEHGRWFKQKRATALRLTPEKGRGEKQPGETREEKVGRCCLFSSPRQAETVKAVLTKSKCSGDKRSNYMAKNNYFVQEAISLHWESMWKKETYCAKVLTFNS